jgi:hypothetical protein
MIVILYFLSNSLAVNINALYVSILLCLSDQEISIEYSQSLTFFFPSGAVIRSISSEKLSFSFLSAASAS